jgi:uncharacterized protein YdgA (DUF945 family)
MRLTVKAYHLGWLHSTATINIASPNALLENLYGASADSSQGMTVEQTITHGPFVKHPTLHHLTAGYASIHSDIIINNHPVISPINQNQSIMQFDTLAEFHGNYINSLTMQGLLLQIPFIGKLTWQGLSGTMSFLMNQNRLSAIQTDLQINPLEADTNFGSLKMANATFQSKASRQTLGLWKVSQVLSIPTVSIIGMNMTSKTTGLTFILRSEVNGTHSYDSSLKVDLEQIITPQITVQPASLTFAINHLDAKDMVTFIKKPPATYADEITQLLTPDTTFTSDMSFGTNHGKFEFHTKGFWSPGTKPFTQLNDALSQLNYEAHIRIAVGLIHHLIDLIPADTNAYSPEVVTTLPALSQTPFEAAIDALVEQKEVTGYGASQLKGLQQTQKISLQNYHTFIDRLAKTKTITTQAVPTLKNLYTTLTPKSSAVNVNLPAPLTAQQKLHLQLNDLIKKGYLIQIDDNYVSDIMYQHGQMRVNGIGKM